MNNGLYVNIGELAEAGLFLKDSGLVVDDMLSKLDHYVNLANQNAWKDDMGIAFALNFSKFISSARNLSNSISSAGKTLNRYTSFYSNALETAIRKMKG